MLAAPAAPAREDALPLPPACWELLVDNLTRSVTICGFSVGLRSNSTGGEAGLLVSEFAVAVGESHFDFYVGVFKNYCEFVILIEFEFEFVFMNLFLMCAPSSDT